MCMMCEQAGSAGVAMMERPAQKLVGLTWEGSFEQAAAGALHPLIAEMRRISDARTTLWKTPIVGLSWNDRPDGFRYFVGLAPEPGEELGAGLEALSLPAIEYATAWHGPDQGEVTDHYRRMFEWLGLDGLTWWTHVHHHREEYPPHATPGSAPALRLMLPVGPAQ